MSLLNALVSADEGSRNRFISGMQGMRQDSKQEEAGRLANEFMNKHEFTPEAFKEFVVKNNIDMPTVQAIAGHIQKIKEIGPEYGGFEKIPGTASSGQKSSKSGLYQNIIKPEKQKEHTIKWWKGGKKQPDIITTNYDETVAELQKQPDVSFSAFTPIEMTKGKQTKFARSQSQYELLKNADWRDGKDTSKTPAEIANDAEKEILTLEEKVLDIRQRMASGAPTFNMGEGENAPPALLQFGTKGPIPTAEGERYIGLINNRISRLRQKMPKPAEPVKEPPPKKGGSWQDDLSPGMKDKYQGGQTAQAPTPKVSLGGRTNTSPSRSNLLQDPIMPPDAEVKGVTKNGFKYQTGPDGGILIFRSGKWEIPSKTEWELILEAEGANG